VAFLYPVIRACQDGKLGELWKVLPLARRFPAAMDTAWTPCCTFGLKWLGFFSSRLLQ